MSNHTVLETALINSNVLSNFIKAVSDTVLDMINVVLS